MEREAAHALLSGNPLDLPHQRGTATLSGTPPGRRRPPAVPIPPAQGLRSRRAFRPSLGHETDFAVGVQRQAAQILVGRQHNPTLDVILRVVTHGESPNSPFVNLQILTNLIIPEEANGHAPCCGF